MPMNTRRAFGEHSAICSDVQNSGFMQRIRAKISTLLSPLAGRGRIGQQRELELAWEPTVFYRNSLVGSSTKCCAKLSRQCI